MEVEDACRRIAKISPCYFPRKNGRRRRTPPSWVTKNEKYHVVVVKEKGTAKLKNSFRGRAGKL